ncbi:glucuronosyltransferase [Nesidiocoris tenuis]|nr:glucuronosyltransferase [Nesidiocoris tenuis]
MHEYLPVLKNKDVQRLAEEKFDLVIMEYFLNDMIFGLVYQIGAPFILVHTTTPYPWMTDLFNEPHSESFMPHGLSLDRNSAGSMTFWTRLQNFVELHFILGFYATFITPENQRLSERYFPNENGDPQVRTVGREASLFMVNTHNSLSPPRPVLPSTIEIGGIHVSPAKPLQEELKALMDNSKGVIFFSLGSVMRGHTMKQSRREEITNVFASLAETILWKWESDLLDKPANVHTSKWFPQRDILAHPKTVLYIGHCGMLGLQEAVIEAVPTVCIPFFADQFQNAKNVIRSGMGLSVDWMNMDEDSFRKAIVQVLREPRFKVHAERTSAAFKDRPMSAKDTAVYWSEYVIRHKGAPHMKSPARQMSWMELNNVDVIATLLVASMILLYLVFKAVVFVLSSVLHL